MSSTYMFSWAGNGLLVKDIRIEEKTIRLGRDLRRQGEKREYKVDSSHCWRKRQKCFFSWLRQLPELVIN